MNNYIKKVTKELFNSNSFLEQDFIYEYGFETIARNLLYKKFSLDDVYKKSEVKLCEEFNKCEPGFQTQCLFYKWKSSDTFFKKLCVVYLNLSEEPRFKYNEYVRKYYDAIRYVKNNISYCNKEIEECNKKNIDNANYKRKLEYFIKLNEEYRKELDDFFINELKPLALEASKGNRMNLNYSLGFVSTAFTDPGIFWHLYRHSPKQAFEVKLKFFNAPVMECEKFIALYNTDINEYRQALSSYIHDNKIIMIIEEILSQNYLLKERMDFLKRILVFYQADKQIFIQLMAIQIEGLFNVYCDVVNTDIDTKKHTLYGKIEAINKKAEYSFYGFVYFSFDFPNIRNSIAHGHVIPSEDEEHLADEMLLDFFFVINMFEDNDLPIFKLINCIETHNDNEVKDVRDIILYLLDNDEKLLHKIFNGSFEEAAKYYFLETKYITFLSNLKSDELIEEMVALYQDNECIAIIEWEKLSHDKVKKCILSFKNILMKYDDYKALGIRLNARLNV